MQLAEELKKIRLGVDDVDCLDTLVQHFVVINDDDEHKLKGEEVSKKYSVNRLSVKVSTYHLLVRYTYIYEP
jgi:hypothetical protein